MKNIKTSVNQSGANASLLLAIIPLLLVGCHTVEGLGTDIRHTGTALESAAEDAHKPCPPRPCPQPPCPPKRVRVGS